MRSRRRLAWSAVALSLTGAAPAAAASGSGGVAAPAIPAPAPTATGGHAASTSGAAVPTIAGAVAWADPSAPTVVTAPTPTATATPPLPLPFADLIRNAATSTGVRPTLLAALVWRESGFDAKARSRAGARGLTQLMPATARELGVRRSYDPAENLGGGARYLASLLRGFGSVQLALAAYNAGPQAVLKHRGVPPFAETRRYVRDIQAFERALVTAHAL